MFCSSIRKRHEWAPAIPILLRDATNQWKEKTLNKHDVAFPIATHAGPSQEFKVILVSTRDCNSPAVNGRLERLSVLSGGRHIAIVLLMSGQNAMLAFSRLQIEMIGDNPIPIMPISSCRELLTCLNKLRKQFSVLRCSISTPRVAEEVQTTRNLAYHCVRGRILSRDQANVLTGVATGFKDIASLASSVDGQKRLKDYLGEVDGSRVISFFSNGPVITD